ncbi:MAG: phage integrase family protein [Mycoplasma sp.]|nr:phage integrase family protein [Mycoplasma sp.]
MNFYNWLLNQKKLSYNTAKLYWYWTKNINTEKFSEEYNKIPNGGKKKIVYFAFKYYFNFIGKTMPKVERPITTTHKNIYSLSKSEYVNIQDNFIDNNDNISLNGKLISELAYIYGMRIGEILKIRWENIKDGTLEIIGKGNKKRFIPMHSKYSIAAMVNEGYIVNIKGNKISYSYAREILEKIKKYVGLTKVITWHSFRHGCAIRMLNSGINIYSLANFLGHSNINTTTIYLRYETEDLKKQMKKLGLFS